MLCCSLELLPPGQMLTCLISTPSVFLCIHFLLSGWFYIFFLSLKSLNFTLTALDTNVLNLMSMCLVNSCSSFKIFPPHHPLFAVISPSLLIFSNISLLPHTFYLHLMHLGRHPWPSHPDHWLIFLTMSILLFKQYLFTQLFFYKQYPQLILLYYCFPWIIFLITLSCLSQGAYYAYEGKARRGFI